MNESLISEMKDSELFAVMVAHNPRKLSRQLVSTIVSADRCASCLGELDTGWQCNDCGSDWRPWILASSELNGRAHDRREG